MIYCVEDDQSIRDLMLYTLNASGFEAEGFRDGEAFFKRLAAKKPKLVMLDIMLPGEDGISILKKLRSNPETLNIPIIMATAKGTEYDKVIGLDLGADDYLTKPFGMLEMISRIKAVLRRAAPYEKRTVSYKQLELNLEEHIATLAGAQLQLTLKEFELLRLFMEAPGRVYTREQLMSSVWGEDYMGETRTVDVHIGTLRSKLGESNYIETVRGVGYRMEKNND